MTKCIRCYRPNPYPTVFCKRCLKTMYSADEVKEYMREARALQQALQSEPDSAAD